MKVRILMSTYNGQTYLAEQIESIQSQTFQDWQLDIRDDHSSDETLAIIERFTREDSRIRLIDQEHPENLGVIASFHRLLAYEEADFYCFSDQDDVWLPEKLEMQLEAAQNYPEDQALLVYTDLKVVNQELVVMSESMIRSQSGHANTSLLAELTENTVTGGVTMINHTLAKLWTGKEEEPLLMHDWYLALLASAFGHLVYIDRPSQLYRQHGNNVLGARTLKKRVQNWIRPHVLFAKYWKLIGDSQKQAKNLLALPLPERERELVENFVTITTVGFWERLRRIKVYGYSKNRPFHTFVFTTLILSKFMYKKGD